MKSKSVVYTVIATVFVAAMLGFNLLPTAHAGTGKILYYTCPMHPSVKSDKAGACPYCNMGLQPVYDTDTPTPTNNVTGLDGKPTPYPLNTCVVSGEKLGEMGKPIEFVYTNNGANQEVKFCCPMCQPKFLKDPDKYMKVIKEAEAKK